MAENKIDSMPYRELQKIAIKLQIPGNMKASSLRSLLKAKYEGRDETVEKLLNLHQSRRSRSESRRRNHTVDELWLPPAKSREEEEDDENDELLISSDEESISGAIASSPISFEDSNSSPKLVENTPNDKKETPTKQNPDTSAEAPPPNRRSFEETWLTPRQNSHQQQQNRHDTPRAENPSVETNWENLNQNWETPRQNPSQQHEYYNWQQDLARRTKQQQLLEEFKQKTQQIYQAHQLVQQNQHEQQQYGETSGYPSGRECSPAKADSTMNNRSSSWSQQQQHSSHMWSQNYYQPSTYPVLQSLLNQPMSQQHNSMSYQQNSLPCQQQNSLPYQQQNSLSVQQNSLPFQQQNSMLQQQTASDWNVNCNSTQTTSEYILPNVVSSPEIISPVQPPNWTPNQGGWHPTWSTSGPPATSTSWYPNVSSSQDAEVQDFGPPINLDMKQRSVVDINKNHPATHTQQSNQSAPDNGQINTSQPEKPNMICCYRLNGCYGRFLTEPQQKAHERQCMFMNVYCMLESCKWTGLLASIALHFRQYHGNKVVTSAQFSHVILLSELREKSMVRMIQCAYNRLFIVEVFFKAQTIHAACQWIPESLHMSNQYNDRSVGTLEMLSVMDNKTHTWRGYLPQYPTQFNVPSGYSGRVPCLSLPLPWSMHSQQAHILLNVGIMIIPEETPLIQKPAKVKRLTKKRTTFTNTQKIREERKKNREVSGKARGKLEKIREESELEIQEKLNADETEEKLNEIEKSPRKNKKHCQKKQDDIQEKPDKNEKKKDNPEKGKTQEEEKKMQELLQKIYEIHEEDEVDIEDNNDEMVIDVEANNEDE